METIGNLREMSYNELREYAENLGRSNTELCRQLAVKGCALSASQETGANLKRAIWEVIELIDHPCNRDPYPDLLKTVKELLISTVVPHIPKGQVPF